MDSDKLGGRLINTRRTSLLWKYISRCNLLDFGYKGRKFTWSNHRKRSKGLIMERLDRIFVNDLCLNIFPTTFVTHFPKTYSNHNPLLLTLSNTIKNSGPRPFHLESYWCNHPDFTNVIHNSWSNNIVNASNNFQKMSLLGRIIPLGIFLIKKKYPRKAKWHPIFYTLSQ